MATESARYELPLWGVVASCKTDQGFGFLRSNGINGDIFFHFSARQPKAVQTATPPDVGDHIVFITGVEPLHPNKPCAVRWALTHDLAWGNDGPPTSQASLDTCRRQMLSGLALAELLKLMQADWYYLKLWKSGLPPVRLGDILLNSIVLDRANDLSANELAALPTPRYEWMETSNEQHKLLLMKWYLLRRKGVVGSDWENWFRGQNSYEVAAAQACLDEALPQDAFVQRWLGMLVKRKWIDSTYVDKWVGDRSEIAIHHFDRLPELRQQAFLSIWRCNPILLTDALRHDPAIPLHRLILSTLLAVDLESDGNSIWEIGYASTVSAKTLFPNEKVAGLTDALRTLQVLMDWAPLVVGHNIIGWDWPILSGRVSLNRPPLLWDTLLVRYLMEPQAKSHALGGNHHAPEDALDSAKLFQTQFDPLPLAFSAALLTGQFQDHLALMGGLIPLIDTATCVHTAPPWFTQRRSDGATLVMPEHRLRELNWVPEVVVVSANPQESLPQQWLQINVDILATAVQSATTQDCHTQVLLEVAKRLQRQNIAFRVGMVPFWLLDRDAVMTVVRQAWYEPIAGKDQGQLVAPMPNDVQPLLAAEPGAYQIFHNADEPLFFDHRIASFSEQVATQDYKTDLPLVRLPDVAGTQAWLLADRPARLLEPGGGWWSFKIAMLPAQMALPAGHLPAALAHKPCLMVRRTLALYPNTIDQAGYWTEVIRAFLAVAQNARNANLVPILLVGSTRSPKLLELLNDGLIGLEKAEVKPNHRSRLEHLRRAAKQGYVVVDGLDDWPAWQNLAELADIELLPVVECLPLEQWFALQEIKSDEAGDEASEESAQVSPTDEGDEANATANSEDDLPPEDVEDIDVSHQPAAKKPTTAKPVKTADVLAEAASHIENNLQAWLVSTRLCDASQAVQVFDPRIAHLGQALKKIFDQKPLADTPLDAQQGARLLEIFKALKIEREAAPSDYKSMEQFLVANWQPLPCEEKEPVKGFKDSQRQAMEAICTRNSDVLVALPTGEGKSVLFQVPALCRGLRNRRLTLVLSPLKALMHDQVDRLHKQGFAESADYLSSDRPPHEITDVLQGVLDHRIVLLYVAPERLRSEVFVTVLRQRVEADGALEYMVVDETHCINQWGHEFRPDYFYALELLLRSFRKPVGTEVADTPAPMLMLSATVTGSDQRQLRDLMQVWTQRDGAALPFQSLPEKFAPPLREHIQVQPVRVPGHINDRDAFDQALEARLPTIKAAIDAAASNGRITQQRSAVLIFVTRREHAEKLVGRLRKDNINAVDYFHAGLTAAIRNEVYQDFKSGKLQVLVATKAFGMGMDIPDIHWAIHLGPPAYLEDYLQEVGRIGRDAKAREKAKLPTLQASLLFSVDDFESQRSQRARSALHLDKIKSIYQAICDDATPVDGEWLALVPQDGFNPPSHPAARRMQATQLRLALFWLEKAQALSLRGLVPHLLEVTLDLGQLERIAAEDSALGLTARVVLGVEKFDSGNANLPTDGGLLATAGNWLTKVIDRLGEMVGFLLGSNRPNAGAQRQAPIPAVPANDTAVINVSQIMLRCSLQSISEVMARLVDLEKRGGLALKRNFQFAPRALALEPEHQISLLCEAVGTATKNLIHYLAGKGSTRFDLAQLSQGMQPQAANPNLSEHYRAAFDSSVVSLARMAGVRMRQVVEPDQTTRWEAFLDTAMQFRVIARSERILSLALDLFKALLPKVAANNQVVSLRELIDITRKNAVNGKFREVELKQALSLLSALRLIGLAVEMLPMSYVLNLKSLNVELNQHQTLWDELEDVNRMAELRNSAMEVFANLPTEAQSDYIEGYFAQSDAAGMEAFLIAQLGNVDDASNPTLSEFSKSKLEQLRATEVTKFFEKYEKSEEPAQWQAICYPYDQYMLVNAGPGAGKTAVLVGRIVHLIREQHIQPSDIVVLAFNRAVVFEIKKRVRDLFRTLGYAAYVKRIRVYTFHGLAMKSMAEFADGANPQFNLNQLLPGFATRLTNDAVFRAQVAANCRCILVDEFQDMTDDIYPIIRQLHFGSGQNAGVMVIGDDDQDILRWHRQTKNFSETYFHAFQKDFGGTAFTTLALKVNFRSGAQIVGMSQYMISEILSPDRNQASNRIKNSQDSQLRACNAAMHSQVDRRIGGWNAALNDVKRLLTQPGELQVGSLAILCRTNAEVAQAHHALAGVLPDLKPQGTVNFRIADLRHVGLWLDLLDQEEQKQNRTLTESLQVELLRQFSQSYANIPEVRRPAADDVKLEDLWQLCASELSFPHLSDLTRFIRDVQLDEFGRLLGSQANRSRRIVSTINKVKGLEFDHVIVLPSESPFPLNDQDIPGSIAMDAAEEARLLYVAMTRAKRRLTYFVGPRENAWARSTAFGNSGGAGHEKLLVGSIEKEVDLGWSMRFMDGFNPNPDDCQAYIESQVSVGDRIILRGNGAGFGRGL